MSIKVRYFASLREHLGRAEDELHEDQALTVRQVWERVNPQQPLPDNVLAAVNMEYVALDSPVISGDVVAFFPPVTGG